MSDGAGFGIYAHWPYCASICPYCDFNVRRDRGGGHGDLVDALIADLAGHAARTSLRGAQSLFLGGGTPSLLDAGDVARIIAAARTHFGLTADSEISVECNPENSAAFAGLVEAGATRLSLGVQALRAPALLTLGRRHSVSEGVRAVEAAAATGARVSADFIYAREGQTLDGWREELSEALALPIEHLSLYQLTIEAGTPFARANARGRMHALASDEAAGLYALTQELTAAAGFPAYEISNHARGAAAQARHNLIYWRGGAWLGIGPGAHGRVETQAGRVATRAFADPAAYVRAVRETGVGWESAEALDRDAAAEEYLLMALRLAEGLDVGRYGALGGRAFDEAKLAALRQGGLIDPCTERVRLTPAGRLVADRVALELSA